MSKVVISLQLAMEPGLTSQKFAPTTLARSGLVTFASFGTEAFSWTILKYFLRQVAFSIQGKVSVLLSRAMRLAAISFISPFFVARNLGVSRQPVQSGCLINKLVNTKTICYGPRLFSDPAPNALKYMVFPKRWAGGLK